LCWRLSALTASGEHMQQKMVLESSLAIASVQVSTYPLAATLSRCNARAHTHTCSEIRASTAHTRTRHHLRYIPATGTPRKPAARRADMHSMCLAYSTPQPPQPETCQGQTQCAQTQQPPSRAEECAANFAARTSSNLPLLPKHSMWDRDSTRDKLDSLQPPAGGSAPPVP